MAPSEVIAQFQSRMAAAHTDRTMPSMSGPYCEGRFTAARDACKIAWRWPNVYTEDEGARILTEMLAKEGQMARAT